MTLDRRASSRAPGSDPARREGIKLALLPKKTRGEAVAWWLDLRYGNDKALLAGPPAADAAGMLARGTVRQSRARVTDAFDLLSAVVRGGGVRRAPACRLEWTREHLVEVVASDQREMLGEPSLPPAASSSR